MNGEMNMKKLAAVILVAVVAALISGCISIG
jgi:predicted small secreted protein